MFFVQTGLSSTPDHPKKPTLPTENDIDEEASIRSKSWWPWFKVLMGDGNDVGSGQMYLVPIWACDTACDIS
jgi:hypothetical protein